MKQARSERTILGNKHNELTVNTNQKIRKKCIDNLCQKLFTTENSAMNSFRNVPIRLNSKSKTAEMKKQNFVPILNVISKDNKRSESLKTKRTEYKKRDPTPLSNQELGLEFCKNIMMLKDGSNISTKSKENHKKNSKVVHKSGIKTASGSISQKVIPQIRFLFKN